MFTVRAEQKAELDSLTEKFFFKRLGEFLNERYPDAVLRIQKSNTAEWSGKLSDLPAKELLELVNGCIVRARRLGFRGERAIATFASYMVLFAPNFNEQKDIHSLLMLHGQNSDERISRIAQLVTQSSWQEASASYRPSAWFES